MNTTMPQTKRSRAERKAANRERLKELAEKHPVSSGKIPLTDYVPPKGSYFNPALVRDDE